MFRRPPAHTPFRACVLRSCNGTVVEDEEMGTVLQFQGDQRDAMMAFLLEHEIAEKSMIKKHGHG